MPYSLEKMFEIWDDKTGDHTEIGPDRDGLDLIEIRQLTSDDKITDRLTFTKEQIPLVIKALQELI